MRRTGRVVLCVLAAGCLVAVPAGARGRGLRAIDQAWLMSGQKDDAKKRAVGDAPFLEGPGVLTTASQKPNRRFPVGPKGLAKVAARLADNANKRNGPNQVGGLESYVCQAFKGAQAVHCHFVYGKHRDFCWFGPEDIWAIIEVAPPHKILSERWSGDGKRRHGR